MKKILCIILALVMCLGPTLEIFGKQNDTRYVSDIKIGYGESGKKALIDAGYTVNENFNANESGRGDSVWIGFLETDNPLDAITDISLMRMNGSYSFSDWENEYAKLKETIDALLYDFNAGIEEFRTNFAKHSPYAEYALELLNYFTDDDFTGKNIGDLLLSNDTTEENIYNIFLMGNAEYVCLIEQCIAMACTEWENPDDTFVTRLGKNGYAKEYDLSANHERELIGNALSDLQTELKNSKLAVDGYKSAYEANKDSFDSLDAYVEKTCNESEYASYIEYTMLVNQLSSIVIIQEDADQNIDQLTFYDLVMKDSKDWQENDYETLRLSMTKGQIGVLSATSLKNLFLFEESVHSQDMTTKMDTIMEKFYELDVDSVSVYYGVDTSVYTNPEDVALTSAAKRELDSSGSGNYGVKKEETPSVTYKILAGVCFALSVAVGVGLYFFYNFAFDHISYSWGVNGWIETFVEGNMYSTSASVIFTIFFIVCIAIFLTAIVMVYKAVKKEPDDIDYKEVPRAIVDLIETNGEKLYYTYTAAKRIDADEDSENCMEIYGDLNAYNKKNEWVVVYYSKNRDLGNPITSEVLVNPSEVPAEGYTAFHEFGGSAAVDLNKCNSGEGSKEIYAYVKTTSFSTSTQAGENGQTGSIFSSSEGVFVLSATFIMGAFLSATITFKNTKKKYLSGANKQ